MAGRETRTPALVYRVRSVPAPTESAGSLTFVEYLLVPHTAGAAGASDGGVCLRLPHELPARFGGRALRTDVIRRCGNGVTEETTAVAVASAAFDCIQHVTWGGIVAGSGVWIVADDCSPRGAFAPAGVAARVQWMSVPVDEGDATLLRSLHGTIRALAGISPDAPDPLSLYHGTATAAVPAISASGLLATHGMLGEGVYVGTLWKAARFASMTQAYEPRPGAVLRVLCFATKFAELPRPSWACACERCTPHSEPVAPLTSSGTVEAGARASGLGLSATICDHASVWAREGWDGAHARVSDVPVGTCRDGTPKYLLRNEEWVIRPSLVVPSHVAEVDAATLSSGGVHYEPLHRGARIR